MSKLIRITVRSLGSAAFWRFKIVPKPPVQVAVARASDAAAVPRAAGAARDQRRRARVLLAAGALPARLTRAHARLAPAVLAARAARRLGARAARPARVALARAVHARAVAVAMVRALQRDRECDDRRALGAVGPNEAGRAAATAAVAAAVAGARLARGR